MSDRAEPPPMIDPDSSRTKHVQLESLIEDMVRDGRCPPGSRLPSENELCAGFSVSRSTVRKALASLERRGLLHRRQGSGTFVAEPVVADAATRDARPPSLAASPAPEAYGAPSYVGGAAATGRAPIGLLLPSMSNEIYPEIVRGVEDVAQERGHSVFIGNTYADRARETVLLQQMLARGVDGLIIEPTLAGFDTPETPNYQLLASWGKPCVLLDNDIPGLDLSRVMIDDVAGGRLAAEHLLAKGHRRIAYVYKASVLAAVDRREGLLAALRAAGIEPEPELLVAYAEEDESISPGYAFTRRLLALGAPPTAIFYFNDELAFQGIRALRELGLRYPRDISIIGFDNVRSAASSDIRLSSIEHPKYFAGRWAADILFDQIRSSGLGQGPGLRRRISVFPELVDRGSVGAPRGG